MRNRPKNEEWNKTLQLLSTTHTLSIRRICKLLKSNRNWVNYFILPHLRDTAIVLPTNRSGKNGKSVDWVAIAANALNKPDLTESNWFSRPQFEKLLSDSIVSVTRQIYPVPVEYFIKDVDEYLAQMSVLSSKISEINLNDEGKTDAEKVKEFTKINEKKKYLWREMVDEKVRFILEEGERSEQKRKKSKHVPVEFPAVDYIERWVAPHDVMNYGDNDEDVYRRFFRDGYIRVEICLYDEKNDRKGKKIFYIKDPSDLKHSKVNQYAAIDYEVWQRYSNLLLARGK